MIPKIIIGLIVCVCVRSLFDHKCIKSTHSAMMRSSKGTYLENKKNQLVVIVDIYIFIFKISIIHSSQLTILRRANQQKKKCKDNIVVVVVVVVSVVLLATLNWPILPSPPAPNYNRCIRMQRIEKFYHSNF